jgi:hypothetical protein
VGQLRGSLLVALAALGVAVTCGSVARADRPEVQKSGIAYAKGHDASHGPAAKAVLAYHNGGVMTSGATIKSIFWGSSWASYTGDKETGIDTFYGGISNTPYLRTNSEYTQTGGAQVLPATSYLGHYVDTSSAGSKDPGTSGVLAEVQKALALAGVTPVSNGYYPVYTDIPRGNAGYCAWHSWGSIGSTPVQYAFFFKLDGDAGCDPGDQGTAHSQGLEAIANVSGHELSEALTDPRGAGWYDRSGAENADKCAWTFGGNVTFTNGSTWKVQGNFSNNAYAAKSGYDHAGCIQTA